MKMTKLPTSKKFKIYKEIRRHLVSRYPLAFPVKGRRPPLKIGILKDILADDQSPFTTGKLRVFLSIWTRSTAYLKSVSEGAGRVELSGTITASVEASHSLEAKRKIHTRRKKRLNSLTS